MGRTLLVAQLGKPRPKEQVNACQRAPRRPFPLLTCLFTAHSGHPEPPGPPQNRAGVTACLERKQCWEPSWCSHCVVPAPPGAPRSPAAWAKASTSGPVSSQPQGGFCSAHSTDGETRASDSPVLPVTSQTRTHPPSCWAPTSPGGNGGGWRPGRKRESSRKKEGTWAGGGVGRDLTGTYRYWPL